MNTKVAAAFAAADAAHDAVDTAADPRAAFAAFVVARDAVNDAFETSRDPAAAGLKAKRIRQAAAQDREAAKAADQVSAFRVLTATTTEETDR
jgi:hypothetical protein